MAARKASQVRKLSYALFDHLAEFVRFLLGVSGGSEGIVDLLG